MQTNNNSINDYETDDHDNITVKLVISILKLKVLFAIQTVMISNNHSSYTDYQGTVVVLILLLHK